MIFSDTKNFFPALLSPLLYVLVRLSIHHHCVSSFYVQRYVLCIASHKSHRLSQYAATPALLFRPCRHEQRPHPVPLHISFPPPWSFVMTSALIARSACYAADDAISPAAAASAAAAVFVASARLHGALSPRLGGCGSACSVGQAASARAAAGARRHADARLLALIRLCPTFVFTTRLALCGDAITDEVLTAAVRPLLCLRDWHLSECDSVTSDCVLALLRDDAPHLMCFGFDDCENLSTELHVDILAMSDRPRLVARAASHLAHSFVAGGAVGRGAVDVAVRGCDLLAIIERSLRRYYDADRNVDVVVECVGLIGAAFACQRRLQWPEFGVFLPWLKSMLTQDSEGGGGGPRLRLASCSALSLILHRGLRGSGFALHLMRSDVSSQLVAAAATAASDADADAVANDAAAAHGVGDDDDDDTNESDSDEAAVEADIFDDRFEASQQSYVTPYMDRLVQRILCACRDEDDGDGGDDAAIGRDDDDDDDSPAVAVRFHTNGASGSQGSAAAAAKGFACRTYSSNNTSQLSQRRAKVANATVPQLAFALVASAGRDAAGQHEPWLLPALQVLGIAAQFCRTESFRMSRFSPAIARYLPLTKIIVDHDHDHDDSHRRGTSSPRVSPSSEDVCVATCYYFSRLAYYYKVDFVRAGVLPLLVAAIAAATPPSSSSSAKSSRSVSASTAEAALAISQFLDFNVGLTVTLLLGGDSRANNNVERNNASRTRGHRHRSPQRSQSQDAALETHETAAADLSDRLDTAVLIDYAVQCNAVPALLQFLRAVAIDRRCGVACLDRAVLVLSGIFAGIAAQRLLHGLGRWPRGDASWSNFGFEDISFRADARRCGRHIGAAPRRAGVRRQRSAATSVSARDNAEIASRARDDDDDDASDREIASGSAPADGGDWIDPCDDLGFGDADLDESLDVLPPVRVPTIVEELSSTPDAALVLRRLAAAHPCTFHHARRLWRMIPQRGSTS